MKLRATHVFCIAVLLLLVSGLAFSTPQAEAKPQDQSPSTAQAPAPQDQASGSSQAPAPETQAPVPPAPETKSPATNSSPAQEQIAPANPQPATPSPAAPAPKPPVLRHRKRKSAEKKPQSSNGKVVVRNGGEQEKSAQLSPAITPAQAQNERATANMLLADTEANLKRVAGRQLTKDEQATLDEIHTYVRQAKAASASGDTNRAHTLAYKARLLSDELARK